MRKLIITCLLIFIVRINGAQATSCSDADVAAQIDMAIALTESQADTDLAARIEEIKNLLLILKQYCYPETPAVVETPEVLPPGDVSAANPAVRWMHRPTNAFPRSDLSGNSTQLSVCARIVVLGSEGQATQISYNDIFPGNIETGWVYADLFPNAFEGRQFSGEVPVGIKAYDNADPNASPILVNWQDYPTITLLAGPVISVSQEVSPALVLSWVRFQLNDGNSAWVPPYFFSNLLVSQVITTQREGTGVRAEPALESSVITRLGANQPLYVFANSDDGRWLHVNPQKPVWVKTSDIQVREFEEGQVVNVTGAVNYRQAPNDTADLVEGGNIARGQQLTVRQVTPNYGWVRVSFTPEDGIPLDGWVNTCGLE